MSESPSEKKIIRKKAMDYLSRREHSRYELYKKISAHNFDRDLINQELDLLIEDGLLSDERFAESYFQSRKNRGYGPLRIRNELKQRGVGDQIFYPLSNEIEWSEFALEALRKKVSGNMPTETKEILKLKRFLNYRGFDFKDIDKAFLSIKSE